MISFTISVLLAFNLQKPPPSKKESHTKKPTKNKTSKPTIVIQPDPETIYNATNVKKAAHIQYDLIPNKLKFELDVICWGPLAKITSTDGTVVVKTIHNDEISWVPICIDHYLDNLALSDIKALYEHVVVFRIQDTTARAAALAKTDRFVLSTEDLGNSGAFVTVSDLDTFQDEPQAPLENFIKNLIMKCANTPKDDVVSWLHTPDDYNIFYESIRKVSSGQQLLCKDFVMPIQTTRRSTKLKSNLEFRNNLSSMVAKGSRLKSNRALVKSPEASVEVKVPAEVFFTDPQLSLYGQQNLTGLLKHAFVLLSCDYLLTRAQKLVLNPLVVKIKKLRNVPVESLKSLGVENLYASYSIPHFAECKSIAKPVESKVVFNESHVFFTESVPRLKLIEFMQTQKLFVEVYGEVPVSTKKPKSSLFGHEPDDKHISRIGSDFQHFDPDEPVTEVSPVLLAVSSFDISSLVENIWDFREIGQCHNPAAIASNRPSSYYDTESVDLLTVCDINIKRSKPSLLRESELIELGTSLEVEVFLMAPQAATLILHQAPHTFKRLFMILNSRELAQLIFNETMLHNGACLDGESGSLMDILTGFVLDNGSNFFFYLEGSSAGFILNVWHMVDNADPAIGKIFFNTDNAFEARLYHSFLDRGLLTITMKVPLQDVFSKTLIYCRKRMPAPCLTALKKICVLRNASHYKCILQQNLLPTTMELFSLDLEWGVPLRWKVKEDK